jgi:hypothetical protein
MPIQQIKLGSYANDGTGDDLRTAFTKANDNFVFLSAQIAGINGQNIGSGAGLFSVDTNGVLQFKTITGSSGVTVTSTPTTVNINALGAVQSDPVPRLGGNLNLNNHNITGTGDIQTTVWGFDIRTLNTQVQTLLSGTIGDQGTFANPIGTYDLGTF